MLVTQLCLIIEEGNILHKINGFETKEQLEFYCKRVLESNPNATSIELISLPSFKLIRKIK